VIEVLLFTLFALAMGALAWWTWQQRQLARRQAEMNEQLAVMGKQVRNVAHDVQNLFAVILPNLKVAREAEPQELPEVLESIERAAATANTLLQALKGGERSDSTMPTSVEGIVRLAIALLGDQRVRIRLRVSGTLEFQGADLDALRVVQNLLANGVREASRTGGAVTVQLGDGRLCMTNPLADGTSLPDDIWEEGVSGRGSSGLGLSIARDAAGRIGWRLHHEVADGIVSFVATREHPVDAAST
jgi:signal transduction histidine kinase